MLKESKTLEFKEKISKTFLKTVSAFANDMGGEIRFGVTDTGDTKGIENPDHACLDIENRINDSILPKPDFSLQINRRTNVITLTIKEGLYKPYLYKGKAYRRSDTATVEVDQIELKRLILEGTHLDYEQLPYKKKKLAFSELEKSLSEHLGIKSLSKDILRTLGLYTKDGYNHAAGILADKNDFPGIDIARFGNDINEILDRITISGQSILNQYSCAISMYQKYYLYEKINGIVRQTIENIPQTAFREAVANALVHRLWDEPAHIRIAMYPDKIEVISPGGLPRGITEEEYIKGNISNLRNPILGNVFYRLHYIEMFGTGIRRIREAYADSICSPAFEVTEHSITVTLPLLSQKLSLTSDEQRIFHILSSGRVLSRKEISEAAGYGKDKTIRLLNVLCEKHYVKTSGNGRGTKYSIV